MNILREGYKIGPVLVVFVSEDEGLTCIEIKVPSPSQAACTAWETYMPWNYAMGT